MDFRTCCLSLFRTQDDLVEILAVIGNRYERELEGLNELLWGARSERLTGDRYVSVM